MAKNKLQEKTISSAIGTGVMSLIAFYIGDRMGAFLELSPKMDFNAQILEGMQDMLAHPLSLAFTAGGLAVGVILFFVVWVAWFRYVVFVGNYRTGEEAGSARWGSLRDGKKFMDTKNPTNNLLFTQDFGLALKKEKFDPATDRNLNVNVIGGSGSGKTRSYVKPNLMQLNANYFVTDPKGTLVGETGYLFEDNGYKVKCFNLIAMQKSLHYNPLAYVKTDDQILTFVNCLILNTNNPEKNGGDAFWENCEKLLYTSLIALMRDWYDPEDYNLSTLLSLLSMAEAKEGNEEYKSPLDCIFDEIETGKFYGKNPGYYAAKQANATTKKTAHTGGRSVMSTTSQVANDIPEYKYMPSEMIRHAPGDPERGVHCGHHGGFTAAEDFALANYKAFKSAAGKTLKSILISCNVRLAPIAIGPVRELLSFDEMELDKLGEKDEKIALFAIPSDTNHTFSFLLAIMIWQTVNILCDKALTDHNGKLPTLVQFILDEFANIGTIPDIETTIAVTRSRNISISIILQSVAQLRGIYDKKADIIVDCCDSTLFLGGKSTSTNEEIAKMIGKETINQATFGESHGQSSSGSKNMQIQGRDLIDPAEIGKMTRTDGILLIAGTDPLRNKKYDPAKHPNYMYVDPGHQGCIYTDLFDYLDYCKKHRIGAFSPNKPA